MAGGALGIGFIAAGEAVVVAVGAADVFFMRSLRCVTRYDCSTWSACCAPSASIWLSCSGFRWPNTVGLKYSRPWWCAIGGVSNRLSIEPGAPLDRGTTASALGGTPTTKGIRGMTFVVPADLGVAAVAAAAAAVDADAGVDECVAAGSGAAGVSCTADGASCRAASCALASSLVDSV